MSTKTKILYFVMEDKYFCSHRMSLAQAALRKGYDVTVVTRVNNHRSEIKNAGFKLIPLDISRGSTSIVGEMKVLLSVWKAYRDVSPHIVHHVALKPILYGTFVSLFFKKIKVVNLLSGLGSVFLSNKVKIRMLRFFIVMFFKIFFNGKRTHVIVQNSDDFGFLVKKLGVNKQAVSLIRGSGVNIRQFCFLPEPKGIVSVALVSRLLWDKGIGEFIESVRLLKQRGIRFRAVLVGDPDIENISSVTQEELELWRRSGIVETTGFVDNIVNIWKTCHIAVLPSYREGLPKSLLEAAACGRPIVTTNVPGCKEIVRHGVNGFLVPAHDDKSLADALEILISDSGLRKKMGVESRKMVEQLFSDERVITETMRLYKSIV